MVAKEYQCVRFQQRLQPVANFLQCATCPDSANCARLLEEKWKQAYHAIFRFGPPQPSMVFRYLRQLEGVSPPLSLTHLSCQTTAKAFVATRSSATCHFFSPALILVKFSTECFPWEFEEAALTLLR
jgi:hypothetical protein